MLDALTIHYYQVNSAGPRCRQGALQPGPRREPEEEGSATMIDKNKEKGIKPTEFTGESPALGERIAAGQERREERREDRQERRDVRQENRQDRQDVRQENRQERRENR